MVLIYQIKENQKWGKCDYVSDHVLIFSQSFTNLYKLYLHRFLSSPIIADFSHLPVSCSCKPKLNKTRFISYFNKWAVIINCIVSWNPFLSKVLLLDITWAFSMHILESIFFFKNQKWNILTPAMVPLKHKVY